MEKAISKLTVWFDAPFWVGVFERASDGRYAVCKVTFGAEPKDCEVYDFVRKHYHTLRFSPSLEAGAIADQRVNPKRMQREINKQLGGAGIGTKAQQALKLQQEQGKLERRTRTRQQREAEQARQFALRQEKHKQKHRGH